MSRAKKRSTAKKRLPQAKIAARPDQPLLENRATVLPSEDQSTSANETHSKHQGRYVYGIIRAREPLNFRNTGIGGAGHVVYSIRYRSLAALVSDSPLFTIDLTRENLLAHEEVVESAMQENTIIPMSFGTVFRTAGDVRELLKSVYPEMKDSLEQLDGKVEFGLRVTWNRDRILERLKRENDRIRHFQRALARKQPRSAYLTRLRLGRVVDDALSRQLTDAMHQIHAGLRDVSVASRDNKPIGEKMLMNAAFLIQRQQEESFREAVNKVAEKFGDCLHFKCTGPWPPYNFVTIRLKVEPGARC